MSIIVTRQGKGLPLTNSELDTNFLKLNADKLEASALLPYLLSATAGTLYQPILGYTAANKAGDTFTGNVLVNAGTDSRTLLQVSGVTQAQFQATASAIRLASNNTTPLLLSTNGVDRVALDSNGNVTLNGGTANGVAYLNGSKVLTTGSALTFDGTNFATTGSVTSAGLSDSGNLTFTGTGNRITGDFSNATVANRVAFQTSMANGQSRLTVIPNGTDVTAALDLYSNAADLANSPRFTMRTGGPGLDMAFLSTREGTGTYLPMTFYTGGSERVRIDTAGNVGIGTSSPGAKLDVSQGAGRTVRVGALTLSNFGSVGSGVTFSRDADNALTSAVGTVNAQDLGLFSRVNIVFATGGANTYTQTTERMRIDNAGNVGIGTSSPTSKLQILQSSTTAYGFITKTPTVGLTAGNYVNMAYFANGRGGSSDGLRIVNVRDSTGSGVGNWETESYRIRRSVDYNDGATGVQEEIVFGQSILAFNTSGGERVRIDAYGNLLVGTTSSINTGRFCIKNSGTQNIAAFQNGSDGGYGINFLNVAGTQVGAISWNASATTYATSSDYRLKNITGPITTSGAYIDSLNPVEGTWKADGSAFVGLIAHEVQEASRTPVATGTKDGEQMQGMDYSSAEIIANLIAEIKSLRARVAALESN